MANQLNFVYPYFTLTFFSSSDKVSYPRSNQATHSYRDKPTLTAVTIVCSEIVRDSKYLLQLTKPKISEKQLVIPYDNCFYLFV